MDNITILSVSSYGQTHSISSEADLTSDDYVRLSVALMRSQGYILSNIEESLEEVLQEVRDEIRVIKKV
jgi:hypothetical protein